jgi:hypothetical protein
VGSRLELQDILIRILHPGYDPADPESDLNEGEHHHVYFQPPEASIMEYPCILYVRDTISSEFANNENYKHLTRYQVTAIDLDPDCAWKMDILSLPMCRHDRFFTSDGLNHDVFELYY